MKDKIKEVFVLPKKWVLPFFASWRTFERTINPAFRFVMVCNGCQAVGAENIKAVMSKKNPKAILGFCCDGCGRVLKFEGLIDPSAKTFPSRLGRRQGSVQTLDGESVEYEGKPTSLTPKDVIQFVLQDES